MQSTPKRRAADTGWVMIVGWIACLTLAGSLTYTFIQSLTQDPGDFDPVFFSLQTAASFLFLLYSIKLGNRVFIAANSVALFNAVGTLITITVR